MLPARLDRVLFWPSLANHLGIEQEPRIPPQIGSQALSMRRTCAIRHHTAGTGGGGQSSPARSSRHAIRPTRKAQLGPHRGDGLSLQAMRSSRGQPPVALASSRVPENHRSIKVTSSTARSPTATPNSRARSYRSHSYSRNAATHPCISLTALSGRKSPPTSLGCSLVDVMQAAENWPRLH
jgi:microcystin-dependent protein